MTLDVRFRASATADLARAIAWYEQRRPGLGARLLDEVDDVCATVATHPHAMPEIVAPFRRALLRRFPFAVYYVARADRIDVYAVFHARRDPFELEPLLRE